MPTSDLDEIPNHGPFGVRLLVFGQQDPPKYQLQTLGEAYSCT